MIDPGEVSARLEEVRSRIVRAGGDLDAVRLVAVTKSFPAEAVAAARAAGVVDVGENYAQELGDKAAAVGGMRWHFLGSIQRRKVKDVATHVWMWHGVDRAEEGEEIARCAPGAAVLVQVNTSGEESKSGCRWDDAPVLVARLRSLGLDVRGLMGIGPLSDPEDARPGFRRLAALGAEMGLPELSMGMSADLEVAVQEGATIVRVGTAIFGPRHSGR